MMGLFVLLFSCAPIEREGTIVGNPSQTRPSLADIYTKDNDDGTNTPYDIPEFWYTGTEGVLVEVELVDPDGQTQVETYNTHMTLLGEDVFELPAGQWAEVTATFEDIYISGYFFEDNSHLIIMDSFQVELFSPSFNSDSLEFNLEIGDAGWLNGYENWSDSDDIVISETENMEAYNSLSRQSALFLDVDGDQLVSLDERENALLAAGPERALGEIEFMDANPETVNLSSETGCQALALPQARSNLFLLMVTVLGVLSVRRRRSGTSLPS